MELNPQRKPRRRLAVYTDNLTVNAKIEALYLFVFCRYRCEVGGGIATIYHLVGRKTLNSNPCGDDGRINFNTPGEKGSGKSLDDYDLNVTMNNNWAIEGCGDALN